MKPWLESISRILTGRKREQSSKSYQPVTRFEYMLKDAGLNPERREDFLRQLFHFEIYILGYENESTDPSQLRTAAFRVADLEDGVPCVFGFTSAYALQFYFDKNPQVPQDCLILSSLDAFKMLAGKYALYLNSDIGFGKIFGRAELSDILNDRLTQSCIQPTIVI